MGFITSYKHLDNLCRDMNGVGVTGYIEDMEKKVNGAYYVPGWKDDYYKLKHYRYIRNQIAHENYADEDNMCSAGDEEWVEEFYQRIMTQHDPLALYRKAINKPQTPRKPAVSERPPQTPRITAVSECPSQNPSKATVSERLPQTQNSTDGANQYRNVDVNKPSHRNKRLSDSVGWVTFILIAVFVVVALVLFFSVYLISGI